MPCLIANIVASDVVFFLNYQSHVICILIRGTAGKNEEKKLKKVLITFSSISLFSHTHDGMISVGELCMVIVDYN